MRISKYISYSEGVRSQTETRLGIVNVPNADQLDAMRYVAGEVFDKVRAHVGGPLLASSFYRSKALNRAIGGSKTSQHCKGEAIDIDADYFGYGTNAKIFYYIKANLEFDQLIWEYGTDDEPAWVHVSLRRDGKNRRQVLQVQKNKKGQSVYSGFN